MSEADICGVLVHVRPEERERMAARIGDLPGTEVHATTEDGRLVVTVEDTREVRCIDSVTSLANLPGVLAASLVYHHCDESLSELGSAS